MNKFLYWFIYIPLLLAIGYMPIYYEAPVWSALLAIVVVAVIEHGINGLRPWIIYVFAKFWWFVGAAFFGGLVGVAVIYFTGLGGSKLVDLVQFTLQGMVIGVVLRQLIASVVFNGLYGRSVEVQRLLMLTGIAVVIWLYPASPRSAPFRGFYVVGVSIGLCAHLLWRSVFLRKYRTTRYAKGVKEMLTLDSERGQADENGVLLDPYSSWTPEEKEAFELFVKNRKRRFNRHILDLENKNLLTVRHKILRAHAERVNGNFIRAEELAREALRQLDRNEEEWRGLLKFQTALALGERGGGTTKDEKMFEEQMNESLADAGSLISKNFLYAATLALRLAEQLPLTDINFDDESRQPLRALRKGMFLYRVEASMEVLSDILGSDLPMRWGFVHDVYAYTLLKAGDFSFSKDLFISCIEREPAYPAAYLHLGEWYIAWASVEEKLGNQSNVSRFHDLAVECLSLACRLERNKRSRIARRALFLKGRTRQPVKDDPL